MRLRSRDAPWLRGFVLALGVPVSLFLIGCGDDPFVVEPPVPFRVPSLVLLPAQERDVGLVIDQAEEWELRVSDESVAAVQNAVIVAEGTGASWIHARERSGEGRDSIPVFVVRRDAERPNVILILTDDQDSESIGFMPTVSRQLSGEGVLFTNAHVTTPICCPSRASFLTGQYAHNHGVLTNRKNNQGGWPAFVASGAEERTIAVALEEAGYRTGLVGKYMNWYPNGGPGVVPPGWTDWYGLHVTPTDFYGYTVSHNGVDIEYGDGPADYQTDVLGDLARSFVQSSVTDGDPFFLLLAPYAPHDPATPAPRHRGRLAGVAMPRLESFNEADVSDKPAFVRNKPLLTDGEIGYLGSLYRDRLESLLSVDDALAGLLRDLALLGERRETYVVFTSDNGFHLGQHRLGAGKNFLYEEDTRVPLVVSGPGVAAARIEDRLVANIDLTHTVAEWAGLGAWPGDGASLAPLLSPAPVDDWRTALLLENWYVTNEDDFATRAVHYADSVYVEWGTGEREFYDLREDPLQLDNLVQIEGRDVTGSGSLAAELGTCAGPTCVVRQGGT